MKKDSIFIADEFISKGIVRKGKFRLKSGKISNIYFDLRLLTSHPSLLRIFSAYLLNNVPIEKNHSLMGVPTGGEPIALCMSLSKNINLLRLRQSIKNHGTGKLIEGDFKDTSEILLIDDVLTTGTSLQESLKLIRSEGFKCKHVIIGLCRARNVEVIEKKLDCKIHIGLYAYEFYNRLRIPYYKSYSERAVLKSIHPLTSKIFKIMESKKTNLILSADVTSKDAIINLAKICGPHIIGLKTHIDIIEDFDTELITNLKKISEKNNFFIFEDRKFADIGNTVEKQYTSGVYRIRDWADVVNAHSLAGPGIIEGLGKNMDLDKQGLLLLSQMSSSGNLLNSEYTYKTVKMAKKYSKIVMGFICQEHFGCDAFIHMTPGIRLGKENGTLGQNYNTPERAIYEKGSDCIIVGSGIYKAKDPLKETLKFKKLGWNAYLKRIL